MKKGAAPRIVAALVAVASFHFLLGMLLPPTVRGFSVVNQCTPSRSLSSRSRPPQRGRGQRNQSDGTGVGNHNLSTALNVVAASSAAKAPAAKVIAVKAPAAHKPGARSLLVGNLASNLSKLFVGPKKAKSVSAAVSATVNGKEVALLAFGGWALFPLCRFLYHRRRAGRREQDGIVDFKSTKYYTIPHIVEQISRIASVIYALDVTTVVLDVLGFKVPKGFNASVAKILYLLYASYRLIKFKKFLLIKKTGKAGTTDKLLDAVIVIATAFGILDILSVQMGMAMQSIFALGGAGTLVASLGSQGLASQIVNGLAIVATGKYYKGEKVIIDDKYVGTVERMNLMSTEIRGSDENILNIPNKQLSGKRVGNITRGRRSAVTQTVWFSYEDIDKIPKVCDDIKKRIEKRCPMLDKDNRPFRAHWRDFKRDHLEVGVQAHFQISPYTNAYYENRQEVLFAIADAAKENNVKFDIPTLTVKTSEGEVAVGKMLQELNGDAWQPNGS